MTEQELNELADELVGYMNSQGMNGAVETKKKHILTALQRVATTTAKRTWDAAREAIDSDPLMGRTEEGDRLIGVLRIAQESEGEGKQTMSRCPHCKSFDIVSTSWSGGNKYPIGEFVKVTRRCRNCRRWWEVTTKVATPPTQDTQGE